MEAINFPQNLVNTIMKCVSTVSFSILVNGKSTNSFLLERGLRQGDPLPPYLFIICADVFSALITKAQQNKLIHGVKIAPEAPEITHLFFADDSLMFCRANKEETTQMQAIINQYQFASGQMVNYNKSELVFSKKVTHTMKTTIQQILPMNIVEHYSKYLGRGTLIKAVAQAIHTYLMSNFLIPKGLCHQMESMIVPIKTNLLAKGILCDSVCHTCNKSMETIEHTFLQCEWAMLVWFGSPLTITTINVQAQTFSDWLSYMLNNSTTDSMQIISTITYSIWLARNNRVFQNKHTPAEEAIARAMKSIKEYHLHLVENRPNHPKQATSVDRNNKSWSPPPSNFLKLNVDAHLSDDGRWGFGLILWRTDGRCVGAATQACAGSHDVAMAEATALKEALLFVEENLLSNTIIELDAELIVKALNRKTFPITNWGK
ncbi:putative ribonuclease H protein, partial [Trifolium medium]|nr:putative ribonuclease H protein [Trifolium medium]